MGEACETPLVDLLRAVPKDARMVYEHTPISHSLIPVGVHSHRAADLIATLEAERDALRAEVSKLRAACAAMDDALRDVIVLADSAMADANRDVGEYDRVGELREARAALATDAGKNYIDATGAVESVVLANYVGSGYATAPAEWIDSRVLIVRVAKP